MEISQNSMSLPGGEILFARLAFNLLESGDVEEATKILEKGLRSYPSYAQAHYVLARCYMKQHLTDEARAELERVLRYDPNHDNAIKDLSSIYFINGFQELYKEYLLKLFTLNPLNAEVIDEVKKLGEYKLWSPVSEGPPQVDVSDTGAEESSAPELVTPVESPVDSVNEQIDRSGDPFFPEKVDLSQFDNVEDDFTTILHGNLELPHKKTAFEEENLDIMKSRENIFAGEDLDGIDKEAEENLESMDDLLGDNEELVINQISETDGVADKMKEGDKTPPDDFFDFSKDLAEATDTSGAGDVVPLEEDIRPAEKEIPAVELEQNKVEIDKIVSGMSESTGQKKEPATEHEHPVMDFDHLQDDEDGKFEQPKIISQTLGEILVSQKKYSEAKSIFEALKEKNPRNKSLDVKIAYLDKIIGLEKRAKS